MLYAWALDAPWIYFSVVSRLPHELKPSGFVSSDYEKKKCHLNTLVWARGKKKGGGGGLYKPLADREVLREFPH